MKKLLSTIIAIVMLLSVLASCGAEDSTKLNGKTPEEVYQASLEKAKELDSFSMTAEQTITIKMDGTDPIMMNQSVTSKQSGHNFYSKISNSALPILDQETWYVDGVLYTGVGGQKVKMNLTWDKYVSDHLPDGATAENAIMNVPEDWFVDGMEFEKTEDGKYCLNFEVDSAKVMDYVSEMMSDGMMGEISSVGNFVYKMYFDKDGNFCACNIEAGIEMSMGGQTASATIASRSIITDVNATAVTAPGDAASYTDSALQ